MTEPWNPEPFEEPPWLQARVDQLLARFDEVGAIQIAHAGGYDIILTTLTEAKGESDRERWERACDNCDTYVPPGVKFFSGHVLREVRGQLVDITFGMCADCKP